MSMKAVRQMISEVAEPEWAARDFPAAKVIRAMKEPTYEALWSGVNALDAFFRAHGSEEMGEARLLLAATLPAWRDMGDGTVMAVPHDAPNEGFIHYHSLGNAILQGGIEASAFDKPLRVEPVYDGRSALEAGHRCVTHLEPDGNIAAYRVAVADGEIIQPPANPADMPRVADDDEDLVPEP